MSPVIGSFSRQYRFLSNFSESVVYIRHAGPDDARLLQCPTVEHAFQACKTTDPIERARIAMALTPGEAKKLGRRVALRPDWDDRRITVMRSLIEQKFGPRDARLVQMLLDTGDAELVEGNTWGDRFWGVCDGIGENHLGRLLMERRAQLRAM